MPVRIPPYHGLRRRVNKSKLRAKPTTKFNPKISGPPPTTLDGITVTPVQTSVTSALSPPPPPGRRRRLCRPDPRERSRARMRIVEYGCFDRGQEVTQTTRRNEISWSLMLYTRSPDLYDSRTWTWRGLVYFNFVV